MIDTDALLEETLALTDKNWGTASVLDFSQVTGNPPRPGSPVVEVTGEAVQDAALRFRGQRVTILNFASAVMPGGGVRWGALAQEEAICLSSGLLHGLEEQLDYYEDNRACDDRNVGYDRMIWSADVPLVRNGKFELVEPMPVNVVTYAAPNAHHKLGADQASAARAIFRRRCMHVVRQASRWDTDVLVLGAWGCGEYANDPTMVAEEFKAAIASQAGSIKRVVFAIYGVQRNQEAFRKVFLTA